MISRILTLSIFLLTPLMAFAEARLQNPVARIMEPGNLIDILVAIFQFLGGPIVVVGLIYAGFKLVTAQGDEHALTEGKRALVWVVVGAAIILGATLLADIVGNTFTDVFS